MVDTYRLLSHRVPITPKRVVESNKTHQSTPQTNRSQEAIPDTIQQRLGAVWQKAYTAKDQNDLRTLYAEWAKHYDEDHEVIGFFGHIAAASILNKHLLNKHARILDAGAGTGAAGQALTELGYDNLTAVDLSEDMLEVARGKGYYRELLPADLSLPIDQFRGSTFDAAILVGVFSYGQAPAHSLDEIIRLVKPGGIIVFTMRTDFYESDAMRVKTRMAELEAGQAWEKLEVSDPQPYLPKKDPNAKFQIWCYRVRPEKVPPVSDDYAKAICTAFTSESPVKVLDHKYIWNALGSRLYNRYISTPDYYLNDCEESNLRTYASEIVRDEEYLVELGCGSAKKISYLLQEEASLPNREHRITYVPIDLSPAAVEWAQYEVEQKFGKRVKVLPKLNPFQVVLPELAKRDEDANSLIVFFGSSIGNFETIRETVSFLRMVRESMRPRDRFLVGIDLHKSDEVLHKAYQAGEPNLTFFLNMIRRINDDADANFDLEQFEQATTYDEYEPYHGIADRRVNFRLRTRVDQKVHIGKLGLDIELKAGDCVQAGISRKYTPGDIEKLAAEAGLKLNRQWIDPQGFFSTNELVPKDVK